MAGYCIYCNKELQDENSFNVTAGSLVFLTSRNAELAAKWRHILKERGITDVRVVHCGTCKSLYIESPLAGGG